MYSSTTSAGYLAKDMNDIEEYASPFWVQFQVLTHRTFLNVFRFVYSACWLNITLSRNPFLFKIQYAVSIIVALGLGYLYWHVPPELSKGGMQNRMGSLFFICTLLSFGSITSIDLCMLLVTCWITNLFSFFRKIVVSSGARKWVLQDLCIFPC